MGSNVLTDNTWFNAMNRPVKTQPAGSQGYTKTAYDLAARVVGTYAGYAPDADDDPWSIDTPDKIFEQTLYTLDAAGNTTLVSFFQRNNGDDSTTGALVSTNARMNYSGYWQDGGGRTIAAANFGINDPVTVPLTPPPSTPTLLVDQTAYNNRGEGFITTDPSGMAMRTDSDDAGRTAKTIQNYHACPACEGRFSPRPYPGEGPGVRAVAGVRAAVPVQQPART